MADVQAAIEYIFPLVYEFRKERTPEEMALHASKRRRLTMATQHPFYENGSDEEEEEEDVLEGGGAENHDEEDEVEEDGAEGKAGTGDVSWN